MVSNGKLKFYFDTSSFKGKGDTTYQELYLMFYADQIIKDMFDSADKASLSVSTKIMSADSLIISSRNWITEVSLNKDSTNLREMVVFDQWTEYLMPGEYQLTVKISAPDNYLNGNLNTRLQVKEMNEPYLFTSDIQFVFKTEELNENSIFSKAGLDVFPNVWRRYGVLNPKLTFYYEIYGIDTTINEPLLIDYTIVTPYNSVAKKINGLELNRTDSQKSILHAIDISTLPSSIYDLTITITDSLTDTKRQAHKKFEVIQLDRFTTQSNLTEEELRVFDKLFKFLADKNEYELYNRLNDSQKEAFIVAFWKKRDPNSSTPENEYLLTIVDRFKYSNQHFGWSNKPGWESDRGRVLIQYGMPNDIKSLASESTTAPYEVWIYQLEKNYQFVFVDQRSSGKYVLVHSDMEGEVRNPSWMSLITK